MKKIDLDEDMIYAMYYNLKCSIPFIANIFCVGNTTIYRIMKKNGWKIRTNSEAHIGIKHSEESKKKMSTSRKGKFTGDKNPMFSRKHTEIIKIKIGEANTKESIGYFGIHLRIRKNKPKLEICEECKQNKKLELSNNDHLYKRDINDYRWLCRSCHKKYDYKMGFI